MSYWLVVGSPENWKVAFANNNIWGLRPTQKHLWESLTEGDNLLFYVTSPIKGLIGFGTVRTKFKQDHPLWPDEIKENNIIWPLRFEFDVIFCIPISNWKKDRLASNRLFPRAGFQHISESLAIELTSSLKFNEYPELTGQEIGISEPLIEYPIPKTSDKSQSMHNTTKDTLVEIGSLQGFLAESEYTFDIGKLDVVWRRVLNSVPTYVFEVQVSGDIYHALAKLKHAYDLWNSHIYIVAADNDRNKVNSLLSGTFHEIDQRINFIELNQVAELYGKKRAYLDFENSLGIK
ncbi:MAG TPA: EVE domain-containing protein [Dehalococcoidia bacterium]|nr:EVE domain-containing protein [Dehalococcoidia bacterium]